MNQNDTLTRVNGSGSGADAKRAVLTDERKLAELLGWASLGLGLPEVASPGRFDRLIGVRPDPKPRAITVVACGLRELAAAAGILALARARPVGWLWARVAGDALDLALLTQALRNRPERPARLAGAIGAVVAISAADVYAAIQNSRHKQENSPTSEEQPMDVKAAITVRRSPEEVYAFLHDFQNLPRFMYHIESVKPGAGGRWHWKAKAPLGSLEWDAEVTEDRPNELIAWRSVENSKIANSGRVQFSPAPRDQGTEIRFELHYDAPGGPLGDALAKLVAQGRTPQAKDDLRRLKQAMETGEVVRSDASPEGATASRLLKQRPAQPLDTEDAQSSARHMERSYV
ncbi:MAG: hypothetical protein QOF69_3496 [Solirubrobacteraceae bacterium]|nr:hypothetical protein [Solirubrobacteraceae bacterium]